MQKIKICDFEAVALIYQKNDVIKILWNDGVYKYDITGFNLELQTLILVSQSVSDLSISPN